MQNFSAYLDDSFGLLLVLLGMCELLVLGTAGLNDKLAKPCSTSALVQLVGRLPPLLKVEGSTITAGTSHDPDN